MDLLESSFVFRGIRDTVDEIRRSLIAKLGSERLLHFARAGRRRDDGVRWMRDAERVD